jgi:anaerobic selenocysteine-containing dehydrogenase
MGLVQGESMAARFFHRLGASFLDRTICASAGAEGLTHTLGGKVGMKVEFFAESRLILIWGSNSIASNLHFWRLAQEAKRQGARLVCIDPRRSETAEKCHEHIALRPAPTRAGPGADARADRERLAGPRLHCPPHPGLGRRCANAHCSGRPSGPPGCAALPVEQITALARDYGTTRPAAIRLNYGMQRVRGGGNATRLVACLPALTGAWRHRAGGLLLSCSGMFPVNRAALQSAPTCWPRPMAGCASRAP